ncbi:glycosyltransferase family 9 protein [Candidatus Nitronereus thalassa]|uniref:Glycosyltransferase family 9 protein n=1 Tax=Candidatus Nitronereus thalassa TaxID=3020898 RepID=A0ABU3K5Z6_9BACT|nr:glycosyltransferase family 9 protein [Candidatus Nitronereus thalassa]MDT7041806.1 glycosyltransferase family 9 protein [Candidatus Nitronereus thalassa]
MLEPFKLSIPDVVPSFDGKLFFILGPGLGDTVNDFRILHEVLHVYPHAMPIVYADPRWNSLYPLLPEMPRCEWRHHVPAPSGELAGKAVEPSYSETFRGVIQEILTELQASPGFVVLGGFSCLDQLARKELGLATKARAIGLPLSLEHCRPFLPLPDQVLDEARNVLCSHGFEAGQYVAIAPQTWADKAWTPICWQDLTDKILEELNLSALVLGVEGCEVPEGPRIRQALGLPLPLVAALISQAKCFVGLDSGLTHVAACFAVPIVGLQAQGKFPPFLVEPHSPLRRIHLTPFVYGHATIPPESVYSLVREALRSPSPLLCPLCDEIPYVLSAREHASANLCRCGLLFRSRLGKEPEAIPGQVKEEPGILPNTIQDLVALRKRLSADTGCETVTYTFDHWNARQLSPDAMLSDPTEREIWWCWDAVANILGSSGWTIVRSEGRLSDNGEGPVQSFIITAKLSIKKGLPTVLQVPWGKDLVWLKKSLYERWLCWESFARSNELEDLGWRLVKEGYERDGRDILRFAAKHEWRGRTLSRLLRSEWKALGAGMKNSQDVPTHA